MYEDQSDDLGGGCATITQTPADSGIVFERLRGTTVSSLNFNDYRLLEVEGQDHDGQTRWRVSVRGSARFTFSHSSRGRSWLVEANFDAGAPTRTSEQVMMLAMCGAVVETFRVEGGALFIGSDDGRTVEMPSALNEEGIVIDILPDEADGTSTRIVLGSGLEICSSEGDPCLS